MLHIVRNWFTLHPIWLYTRYAEKILLNIANIHKMLLHFAIELKHRDQPAVSNFLKLIIIVSIPTKCIGIQSFYILGSM